MLIEIFGGGIQEQGAQLMLETVVEHLRRRDPSIEFCMESSRRENAAFLAKRGFKSFPIRTHAGGFAGRRRRSSQAVCSAIGRRGGCSKSEVSYGAAIRTRW